MLHEPLSHRQDNFITAEEVIAQNMTEWTNIAESLTNALYHNQLRDTYCCGLIAGIKVSQLDEKGNEMASRLADGMSDFISIHHRFVKSL